MRPKKILYALLFPPVPMLLLLSVLGIAGLFATMTALREIAVLRITAYVSAFYMLTVWCARVPQIVRFCKRVRNENKYIRCWLEDPRLRMNVTVGGTLLWNGAYGALQLGLGIRYGAAWFYALAAYYVSLAVMRACLVRYTLRHRPGENRQVELRIYRICGWALLLMTLALSGMMFYMIRENRATSHHEIMVIAQAAYTFFTLIWATVNLRRYRKYRSPVLSAARAVSLAAACISLLTLENTMLVTFGADEVSSETRLLFLALSGVAISIGIVISAVRMIFCANRNLKESEKIQMEHNENFKMTYSAKQQAEIQAIRKKYAPQEDKMEKLRALDAGVTGKATVISVLVGVLGALLMGIGMSLIMTGFGAWLGVAAFPCGIAVGGVGLVILTFAYPLYTRILKKERERIAPEVLRLSEELLR